MKRYNCTSSDKRGAFGLCMEEHEQGSFVPFSEVDPLNQRINQLLEERNSTGLAISNAILSGVVPDKHPLRSRLELLANHHKRERELESLLREARSPLIFAMEESSEDKSVAIEELIDTIDSVLAGKVLERIGNNALAMMMDELHDICVGLDAPGGAQNGAEAWDQVKGARDRVLASLNQGRPDTEWTDATTSPVAADYRELQEQHDQLQSKHKVALDLLQESHEVMRRIIPPLPQDCANRSDLLDRVEVALAGKFPLPAWYLDGAKDFKSMMLEASTALFHPHIEGVFAVFERRLALDEQPQGGEPLQSVSPPLNLLIRMTDILKMCRAVLITAHPEIKDETGKRVIQYRIKLATEAINMAEHAIDVAQVNSGRFITEGQELELVTVLQSIVNGFSDDPTHDAAALLKRITGEVPWTGDSFRLPPRQGGEQIVKCPHCNAEHQDGSDAAEFIGWHGLCATCELKGGEPCATEPPSSSQD